MKGVQTLLKLGVIGTIGFHLVVSPYTKVEESFNLQAMHDILNFGVVPFSNIESYDHKSFPGVVPRTFIGALAVSGIATPILKVFGFFGVDLLGGNQINVQFLIRLIIGVVNGLSLISLSSSVDNIDFQSRRSKKSSVIGTWYLILLLSQFHILYYSSRTLPNFLALPLVNHGVAKLIKGDSTGLTWLAFTGIVFRLEVAVFAVVVAVISIVFGSVNVFVAVLMLAVGTISGGVLSYVIDTKFWGTDVVPELVSFFYNVVEGKSANWGVEPLEAYFTTYIPKLFKPPVVVILSIIGLIADPANDGRVFRTKNNAVVHRPSINSLRILFISSVVFVGIMSLQPHKEWRFIIYIVPIVTLVAGNGFAVLMRRPGVMNKLLVVIFVVLTMVAGILSLFTSYVSSYNYPGGVALQAVNEYISTTEQQKILVHMDVATCMTGASRFGELHNHSVVYDKSETMEELRDIWSQIDILVSEKIVSADEWEMVSTIPIFDGISLYPLIRLVQLQTPQEILTGFYTTMVEIIQQKDWIKFQQLLDIPIVKKDYLFVFKRIEHTGYTPAAEESIDKELEDLATEDVVIDDVVVEINEEIDQIESSN